MSIASQNNVPQGPPLVSVIIPTHNHAHFITEAIQSVFNQSYRNYEVIVIDDGSMDNTREVVARFSEDVRYIRQGNRGLSSARNRGIEVANGDYIALLDADDTWLPGFLSTVVERLESEPELGAVYTGFFFVNTEGELLPQRSTSTVPDNQLYDRLLDGEFFVPAAVVARRLCFECVGLFDEALRGSEDWDMWLRVAREFPFAGISEPLVNYRIHGKNMSADPEYMLHYQLLVAKKQFGPPDGVPEDWPPERQRVYATIYRYAAQGFFLRGCEEIGQHYLRLALETNPSLAGSLDLFYELGCSDQPLGWKGNLADLNLESNAALLLSNLDEIFARPDLSVRLRARRSEVFSHAYLALGLLAYGSNRLRFARSQLLRVAVTSFRLARRRQAWATLLKTLLGRRLIKMLRSYSSFDRGGTVK